MTQDESNQVATNVQADVQLVDRIPSGVSWSKDMRGLPRIIARSGIFGLLPAGLREDDDRGYFFWERLPTASNLSVEAGGRRLSMVHQDAWLECLHLARYEPLGADIPFTDAGLLAAMGLGSRGGRDRRWARALVEDLAKPEVTLNGLGAQFHGTLLEGFAAGEKAGSYVFRVPPGIWPVLRSGYVQLKVADRRALRGNQLALWLYAFYASHERIIPLKPDTLAQYCGSRTVGPRFLDRLKAAMNEIREKTGFFVWCLNKHGNVAVFRADQSSAEYREMKVFFPHATHREIMGELALKHLFENGPN